MLLSLQLLTHMVKMGVIGYGNLKRFVPLNFVVNFHLRFQQHTCSHCSIFQDYSVVDEPDVLGWILAAWPFTSQQMKDFSGENSMFTVFNEFTQMAQSCKMRSTHKKIIFRYSYKA